MFKHASLPFILAFLASILATILSTVAPATISINPTYLNRSTDFMVGGFDDLIDQEEVIAATFLSNALVFLEQIQNVSYGYEMPDGTLFGMPGRDLLGQNLSWTFDVVYYNYTCSYRAPTYQTYGKWVVDQATYIPDENVSGDQPTLSDRTGFFSRSYSAGYDIAPLSGKIFHQTSSELFLLDSCYS